MRIMLSLFSVVFLLTCAPVVAEEPATRAAIRGDGTLLVDGKPVFPIGMFSATLRGENCTHIADIGFNAVTNGGDTEQAFFESAHDAGLIVLAPHYNWATFTGKDELFDLDKHEAAGFHNTLTYRDQIGRTLDDNLKQFDHLPGVIGWYTSEEPKASYVEGLTFVYELIKSRSPSHLVTIISAEPVWYHQFRDAVDVLMVDCYPYRPGDRAQPEISSYDVVRTAREAMKGKPVWMVGQAGCAWKNWVDVPLMTEDNYRNQAYLSLIAGAKGYWLFSYPIVSQFGKVSAEDEAGQWEKIRTVVGELCQLSPALCDGRDSDQVRISWKLPEGRGMPPLTRVIEHDGEHILLVANLGHTAMEAKVLGTNYGYPEAFEAHVLTNATDLTVLGRQTQTTGETVNAAKTAMLSVIRVAPGSTGAFRITRRPALLGATAE